MSQLSLRISIVFVLLVVAVLAGCAIHENAVRKRATFDLECSQEKLQIQEIGISTFGVRGCGRKATYVCPTQSSQCILDSLDGEAKK